MAAHRDPTVRLADDALEILQPAVVIAGGFMDPGIGWGGRLNFLKLHYPVIWKTFGEDALQAAAQPLPAGTCRWCWSWALAQPGNRRQLLARAMLKPGIQRLLGTPCKVCIKRVLQMTDARMRTGRRGAAATRPGGESAGGTGSRKVAVLTTSPAAAPRHNPLECGTCASPSVAAETGPHNIVPLVRNWSPNRKIARKLNIEYRPRRLS